MSQIILRPKFLLDAQAIWNYIAQDQLANANNWLSSLNRSLMVLATQPRMGQVHPRLQEGFRYLPFGNYLILYKVIGNQIAVYRIIHKARKV